MDRNESEAKFSLFLWFPILIQSIALILGIFLVPLALASVNSSPSKSHCRTSIAGQHRVGRNRTREQRAEHPSPHSHDRKKFLWIEDFSGPQVLAATFESRPVPLITAGLRFKVAPIVLYSTVLFGRVAQSISFSVEAPSPVSILTGETLPEPPIASLTVVCDR